MNRRAFFRGLCAAALATVARAWSPAAALVAPKPPLEDWQRQIVADLFHSLHSSREQWTQWLNTWAPLIADSIDCT